MTRQKATARATVLRHLGVPPAVGDGRGERDQEPGGHVVDRRARERERADRALEHAPLDEDPREHREGRDRHGHAHEQGERDELLVGAHQLVERQRHRDPEHHRQRDARVRDRRGLARSSPSAGSGRARARPGTCRRSGRGWPRPRRPAGCRTGTARPAGSARSRRGSWARARCRPPPRPSHAAGRSLTASEPNRRATSITTATASKKTATRCPKDSRCSVAVTFSPDGGSPDGVVSTGLPAAAAGARRSRPGPRRAAPAVRLLRLRSTASP